MSFSGGNNASLNGSLNNSGSGTPLFIPVNTSDRFPSSGEGSILQSSMNNINTSSANNNQSPELTVKVAVRIRPMLPKEKLEKSRECVTIDQKQIIIGKDRTFAFDYVFGQNSMQVCNDKIQYFHHQNLVSNL